MSSRYLSQGAQQALGAGEVGVHSFTQQIVTEGKYSLVLLHMASGAQMPDLGLRHCHL